MPRRDGFTKFKRPTRRQRQRRGRVKGHPLPDEQGRRQTDADNPQGDTERRPA